MKKLLFFLCGFSLSSPFLAGQSLPLSQWETVLQIHPEKPQVSEPFRLEFSLRHTKTGKPPHHFMMMHEKKMHTILVSEDLQEFVHVHPYEHKGHHSSFFSIDLNQETNDPDNFMAHNAVVRPGRYFVFTESMPHAEPMQMAYGRFEFFAKGKQREGEASLSFPDFGDIQVKHFDENFELAEEGAPYRVVFEIEQTQMCQIFIPRFYFSVAEWNGETYEPVSHFENWLGMGGHAVLVGLEGKAVEDREFHHLHAFLPIAIPGEFTLPYHDHSRNLPDGFYRIWGQFRSGGRVLTFPFEFSYKNPQAVEISAFRQSGC